MKLAPTITSAATSAHGGWLARVLRAGAVGALLGLVGAGPALAQRHDHERFEPRQDPRVQQDQRAQPDPRAIQPDPRAMVQAPQRFEPRAFDSREFDRQDPAMRQEPRRGSRMTPDERRDLRRQINEAGMDLYARPPRH